jgi:PA14 domain
VVKLLAVLCVIGAGLAQEPATPAFGTTVVVPGGLRGDIYFLNKGTTVLPDFAALEPVGTIWASRLNVPPRHWTEGFPGITERFEWFAINYTGRFWIEKPGRYSFALLSDDGSKLYIDDNLIIDNDCQHPPDARIGAVTLSGGLHRIRVPFFQGPRDCLALVLAVAGPEGDWRVFSTEEFKPPANPENWKYASPDALAIPPDQAVKHAMPAKDAVKPPKKKRDAKDQAEGCMAYPVRICGATPMPHLREEAPAP